MSNAPRRTTPDRKPSSQQHQVVDPRWLVRALGAMIVVALLCGYLTLGLMFYLSSWQLVLHPTHGDNGGTGVSAQTVRFGDNPAGTPQITGEWLPAPADSTRGGYAVLYLRGADGQLDRGDGTQIAALNRLGLSVLAFDYRGYGRSAAFPHPAERRMREDAEAAWNYLTTTRHISPDHVILFGSGIGVSLAAMLLEEHPNGAALIGYNADPEVLQRAERDPRAKLFPLRLVFHDRFPLDALKDLHKPKLLYTVGAPDMARREVYRTAGDPKLTVEVPTHNAGEENAALSRFLDSIAPAPTLMPVM